MEQPLAQFFPPVIRKDRDNYRIHEAPKDITSNNAPRDTWYNFGHITRDMEACGALGTQTLAGPTTEGTMTSNRGWDRSGEIWPILEDEG